MNRTTMVAALIACGILATASAQAADKFASVDMLRVFSEYSKTKDYDKTLSDKQAAYEGERDKKVSEIQQAQEKMNLLSDKEKEAKKGDLEKKIKDLQAYDRQQQTDLRKEQDDKTKELIKDITDTINKYAEKEGYTLIFNDRALVYQSKGYDITDKIIELVNAGSKPAKK